MPHFSPRITEKFGTSHLSEGSLMFVLNHYPNLWTRFQNYISASISRNHASWEDPREESFFWTLSTICHPNRGTPISKPQNRLHSSFNFLPPPGDKNFNLRFPHKRKSKAKNAGELWMERGREATGGELVSDRQTMRDSLRWSRTVETTQQED